MEEFYRAQSIYDIIAKVNADSKGQLNEIVVRKVREMEGIKNTLTMIIILQSQKRQRQTEKEESKHSYFLTFFTITQDWQFQITSSSST